MSLNGKKVPRVSVVSRVQQAPLDPGTYPARLVQIIDFGVQTRKPYKGEEKKPAHMIGFTYECLDEFCVDEKGEVDETKPRWVSEEFPLSNLSSDLAKSTKRYNALDPNDDHDGDFSALVETPCNITVVNNENGGKVYNNIGNVSAMRPKDAAKAPALVNPTKVFLLDEPDLEVFLSFPDWIQEKIKGNLNYTGSALEKALKAHTGGDSPAPKATPKPKEEDVPDEPEDDDKDDDIPW